MSTWSITVTGLINTVWNYVSFFRYNLNYSIWPFQSLKCIICLIYKSFVHGSQGIKDINEMAQSLYPNKISMNQVKMTENTLFNIQLEYCQLWNDSVGVHKFCWLFDLFPNIYARDHPMLWLKCLIRNLLFRENLFKCNTTKNCLYTQQPNM